MTKDSVWNKAQNVKLDVCENILPQFDIGFNKIIPESTKQELCSFINWIENNYHIPITLWVDFEYKHYLISSKGKRVGYLFYWSDFVDYPTFKNKDEIPQIRLPVRTERYTIEEILTSFIEAITCYYAWICNEPIDNFLPNNNDVDEILDLYLHRNKI